MERSTFQNKKMSTDSSYYEQGSSKPKQVTSATVRKLAERNNLIINSDRLVIALVGLPGRGKSFIARKLQAYFSWQCIPCKIFNVGKYRRIANAEHKSLAASNSNADTDRLGACDASFFDAKNEAAKKLRNEVAMLALTDALDWLDSKEEAIRLGGIQKSKSIRLNSSEASYSSDREIKSKVAIFDATNSTNSRREAIIQHCTEYEKNHGRSVGVVFIESVCDDEELLLENYRMKVSVSPDYKGLSEEEALKDVRERVRKYEEQYETIQDDSLSYIKIFNLSSKLLANLIYGRMSKAVVPALMAWHVGNRPIYLCRPGKTEESHESDAKLARCGKLDELGLEYRRELSRYFYKEAMQFLHQQNCYKPNFNTGTSMCGGRKSALHEYDLDPEKKCPGKIMCSTMPRAIETACWEKFSIPLDILSNLNPLDKGDFSGRELDDIKDIDPVWYSLIENDPYGTRFPGGECYHDLINRLESCVIEMEQQVVPVLVVSHVSVIQVLLSYFRNTPVEQCTSIEVPLHTVIKLVPADGGGWKEFQIPLVSDKRLKMSKELSISSKSPIWTDHGISLRNVMQNSVN